MSINLRPMRTVDDDNDRCNVRRGSSTCCLTIIIKDDACYARSPFCSHLSFFSLFLALFLSRSRSRFFMSFRLIETINLRRATRTKNPFFDKYKFSRNLVIFFVLRKNQFRAMNAKISWSESRDATKKIRYD